MILKESWSPVMAPKTYSLRSKL